MGAIIVISFELDNLKLSEAEKARIRSLVASGKYATESEFFEEALRLLLDTLRQMDRLVDDLTPNLKMLLVSKLAQSIRKNI